MFIIPETKHKTVLDRTTYFLCIYTWLLDFRRETFYRFSCLSLRLRKKPFHLGIRRLLYKKFQDYFKIEPIWKINKHLLRRIRAEFVRSKERGNSEEGNKFANQISEASRFGVLVTQKPSSGAGTFVRRYLFVPANFSRVSSSLIRRGEPMAPRISARRDKRYSNTLREKSEEV